MKRRLFLKTGSVGIGGMLAMPTVIYGCASLHPITHGPSKYVSFFTDGSRLFDASIAELRTSGSGELASAEAEDVTLSGTGDITLFGLGAQVANKQAAQPAELAEDFAESSTDMLNAAGELFESAPELFPLGKKLQAEVADDFALLKVVKASTLLASAAAATPHPGRKVFASSEMITSAELVHKAVHAENAGELFEGTEHLLAYSEEYVGACEVFSAEFGFAEGVESFETSVEKLAEGEVVAGISDLLTSTDNIALSAEYYADGADNLNAEAEIFNAPADTIAEDLIPWAEQLVTTTPLFIRAAKGLSAERGALAMHVGSAELLHSAENDASSLDIGGEVLDIGSDQFIGGEITYASAEFYAAESNEYLNAAENFENGRFARSEARFIRQTSHELFTASENFYSGAKALQSIERPHGVKSMFPATEELLEGAEILHSEANNEKAEQGAEEMVIGASEALLGAERIDSDPAENLESGAETIEIGTNTVLNGAEMFVQGYRRR